MGADEVNVATLRGSLLEGVLAAGSAGLAGAAKAEGVRPGGGTGRVWAPPVVNNLAC